MKLELLAFLFLVILHLAVCSEMKREPVFDGEPVYEAVEEWRLWKSTHDKSYDSKLEELERHIVWLSNKAYVEQHNINAKRGVFSYEVKLNHLADLTDQDYQDKYLTYRRSDKRWSDKVKVYNPPQVSSWPDSIDWRTKEAVTPVKHQANCGASYAFATTGTLEGAYALTYDRRAISLSEQNLVDCSVPEGNNGCDGGNMYNSFMYVIFNDGINTASAYKYEGKQHTCNFTALHVGATMSGIIAIRSGSERDLQAAVTYAGPVAAAVDARRSGFRFYSRGVYDSYYCSSTAVNHAVLVVGYGTTMTSNGYNKDYWILKNSWGEEWGEEGYIWMSRNSYNQCGIATDCSYPSL